MRDAYQDTPKEQLAARVACDAIPRMASVRRWPVLDMALAFCVTCLLAPLLLSVATLALLSQGRPLFHKVEGTGSNGRRFRKLTFRASRVDTSFGRVLRSTNTSELPLLWNILRGDMSFANLRARDDGAFASADTLNARHS
ncbi:MAG: sugar transferase [Hyphomicrobiales bacterium]|nr:sugar transferase [Hyphomicrobiales bacterium]